MHALLITWSGQKVTISPFVWKMLQHIWRNPHCPLSRSVGFMKSTRLRSTQRGHLNCSTNSERLNGTPFTSQTSPSFKIITTRSLLQNSLNPTVSFNIFHPWLDFSLLESLACVLAHRNNICKGTSPSLSPVINTFPNPGIFFLASDDSSLVFLT